MKPALILLLLPMLASAEIFKCTQNGQTQFSDSPCGKDASIITIDVAEIQGYQFSNSNLKKLADKMHEDRMRKDLDNRIERQRAIISQIESDHSKRVNDLEQKLNELKSAKNDYKWRGTEEKRQQYYDLRDEIDIELDLAKREYDSEIRKAQLELSDLLRKRERY